MQEIAIVRRRRSMLPTEHLGAVLFAVFFGLVPALSLLSFLPFSFLVNSTAALVFLGAFAFASVFLVGVLRKSVPSIALTSSVWFLWAMFASALMYAYLSNTQSVGSVTSSLGIESLSMLGILALLASVASLYMQKIEHIRFLLRVLSGSVVLLALVGISVHAGLLPLATPATLFADLALVAGATLIVACTFLRLTQPSRIDALALGLVSSGAGVCLALGAAPLYVWGVLAAYVGLLSIGALSSVLRVAPTRSVSLTPRQHRGVSPVVLSVLGAVWVMLLVGTFADGKLQPFVLDVASSRSVLLSSEESQSLLTQTLKSSPFFGVGYGQFQDTWFRYLDEDAKSVTEATVNPAGMSSFLFTYLLQSGFVGGVLLLAFLLLFVLMGVRSFYFPEQYDRSMYIYARAVFMAGLFLWVFAFLAPSPTLSLYLAALLTGVLAMLYGNLVPSHVFKLSFAKAGKLRTSVALASFALLVSSVSGMYWISAHVLGEQPRQTVVTEQIAAEVMQYVAYLKDTEVGVAHEDVLERTKQVTTLVVRASEQFPYDTQILSISRDLFGLLSNMGIEGAAVRVAEIDAKLAILVPQQRSEYISEQAQYLFVGKENDKSLELITEHFGKDAPPDMLKLRSYIYGAKGDRAAALESLRAYIDTAGGEIDDYLALGVYTGYVQSFLDAVPIFAQAIQSAPATADGYVYLSLAYAAIGNATSSKEILLQGKERAEDTRYITQLLDEYTASSTITSAALWSDIPQEKISE